MKKMNNLKFGILLGMFIWSSVQAQETPIVMPGAAATCIGCHGPQGISNSPLWPNLAGQKKDYLIKQLNDFKKGLRKDPMMNPMVVNLSEADIEALGQYFSSLK